MLGIFLEILRMSFSACWLILAVLLVRKLLGKTPKWLTLFLWAMVAVRLLVPVYIESKWSVQPDFEIYPEILRELNKEATVELPFSEGNEVIHSMTNSVTNADLVNPKGETEANVNRMQIIMTVALVVWILGILGMLLYMLLSCRKVKQKIATAVWVDYNIWMCDDISSPFIYGIFEPKIYLPSSLLEENRKYVIAHENVHIERKDYLWKPLGFLILVVHWFNPFVWVAYEMFCRDLEFSCDESALEKLGAESKKPYANALISCSVSGQRLSGYAISIGPVAFGEVGVKKRVKHILNYKKPMFVTAMAAFLLCAATVDCAFTNPKSTKDYYPQHMLVCGEQIEYNGFTFTLERYALDKYLKNGCFELSVEKEGMNFLDAKLDRQGHYGTGFYKGDYMDFSVKEHSGNEWYFSVGTNFDVYDRAEIVRRTKDKLVLYVYFTDEQVSTNGLRIYDCSEKGFLGDAKLIGHFDMDERQELSIPMSSSVWCRMFLAYDMLEIIGPNMNVTDLSIGMDDGREIVYLVDGEFRNPLASSGHNAVDMTSEEQLRLYDMELDELAAFLEEKRGTLPKAEFYFKEQVDLKHVRYLRINGEIFECEK